MALRAHLLVVLVFHAITSILKMAEKLWHMVKSLKEGVIITDVAGLHSGVNTVSGDFSVQSSGFYVKDGKIVHPVTLIVLSGNFYEMLKQVDKVGNDLRFDSSSIGSPSLKIKKMSISS